mgnify:CR=1 FL=1
MHIYWSVLKNIKVKNMEILCKKILTTLLIYSKIAMFECWLLSLAPIFADCVGCIFLSDIGSVQQVLLLIVYWLEGEFSNGEKTFSFVYGYSFEWWKTSKDDGARIIGEYLRMKSDDDLKFRSYINREDTNVAYYLASPTGRCSKQLLVDNNILALNKLANFDDLFYIDSIRQLNRLDVREIGTLQHPDSLFNMIAPDDDVNELSLDYPRESKVDYYLNSLKKLAPNKYELLKDVVTGLLVTIEDFEPVQIDLRKDVEEEETKDLPFRLPETFYDVRVKERYNNQYTSISRISSGSKKIFFILTLVIAAEINKIPLLLLEELENSVHPRLLQNLLTAIVQLAGDTKVLITSHSPYLIKYLEPTKMKFGIPTELGVADFRSLKPNKVAKVLKNASAEEVSVGEYMFEMLLDMDCNDELINEYFK